MRWRDAQGSNREPRFHGNARLLPGALQKRTGEGAHCGVSRQQTMEAYYLAL